MSTCNLNLYNGDVNDYLPNLPDECVDLTFTSPPYNIGKIYETKIELEKYLHSQEKVIKEVIRVTKDTGNICWQVGTYVDKSEFYPLDIYFYSIFKDLGLFLRNRIVWTFGHGLHATKKFSGRHQTILWFSKSDHYTFNLDDVRVPSKYPGKRHYQGKNVGKPSGNPKGKNPTDFWKDIVAQEWEEGVFDIPNVKSNHPEKTIHPCQFPIELAERCILALSNEGDLVLDPFAGVGSTLLAAVKHNRRAIGAEKDDLYCAVFANRLDKFYEGTLPMRQLGKPIYAPTGVQSQRPAEWT